MAQGQEFETTLIQCLHCILDQLTNESLDVSARIGLCTEITEFLINTPPVFQASDLSWTRKLFNILFHFVQNKWSHENRVKIFRLLSTLAHGAGKADWFRYDNAQWTLEETKFIGLTTRLACVEVMMMLESPSVTLNQDLIGCCLIILEKSLLLLSEECDNDDSQLIGLMNVDEVTSIISSMRDVSAKIIEFLTITETPVTCESLTLSLVRFMCLLLVEDTHVTPGQAEAVLPVLFTSLRHQSSSHPGCDDHAILSALVSLFERTSLDPRVMSEEDALFLTAFSAQCDVCKQLEESVCQGASRIAERRIQSKS